MKKKVLHLIPSFNQGGSEQQAVQLVKALKKKGTYRVMVACLDRCGVLFDGFEEIFGEVPEFPLTSFYDANMVRQLRRCAHMGRENSIDIIQTHDFYTNIFGMAAAAMARIPVRIAAKRETGMRSKVQRFIERRAFGLADVVIANAERVKEFLVESGVSQSKISVIHNGIDTHSLISVGEPSDIRKRFGLPDGPAMRFVTIVANLRSPVKNHRMFLKAAAIVRREVADVNFIIAGEGELLGEMRAFADDLGLSDAAIFIGRCSAVADLLSISDVCCLTSESEGFSNSILEYMAAGKPVVATNVGGISDAVTEGESGFLVASNDDKALAGRLIELLIDREKCRRMGSKGQAAVRSKFSIETRRDKTLELYERLLGKRA